MERVRSRLMRLVRDERLAGQESDLDLAAGHSSWLRTISGRRFFHAILPEAGCALEVPVGRVCHRSTGQRTARGQRSIRDLETSRVQTGIPRDTGPNIIAV